MLPEKPITVHEGSELDIKSILVVEDEDEIAEMLKAVLETKNFVVTLAPNGVEGVREILALDFDVIVCDLMMPKMAGDMFYLAVERAKPHLCKRFLFITGQSDNVRVEEFLKKIDAIVLFKPVRIEELLDTVGMVLKRGASS
jgi:DNA-binding response OmpR family regulator